MIPSRGKGFKQPLKPHEHWHTDISYVKIEHRFHFFICMLDGYSRYIVHWDLRENMKENEVAIVQQTALEKYQVYTRVILLIMGNSLQEKNSNISSPYTD